MSGEDNGSDKRRGSRGAVQTTIEIVRGDQRARAETADLTPKGVKLRVEIDPPLTQGEQVVLHVWAPELLRPAKITSVVRWVSEADSTYGLEFVEGLRDIEAWALKRLYDRLTR